MEENNNNENKIVEKGKQVAKDAVKNAAKETMKKILPTILPAIGWFVLIILAMGLINLVTYMITSWFTSIFHPKKADTSGEDEVKSVISINQYGGYDINTDNFAEQVLKELENKHVSTELMGYTDDESEDSKNEEDSATTEKEQEKEQEKLKKDLNSMIDKYVKAEVQTMYPRTGRYGDVDGLITIKKMSAETGKTKTLTYITYDEFNNRNDSALCNCFSLEPETFKLWIATEIKTEYYMYDGTDEGSKVDTKSDINKISYDYKTSVQGYGIPFNFLISLHNTVQEKKFMKEVLSQILDKNEPIILTFVESSAKTTILKEYKGEQWVEVTTTMKPPDNALHSVTTKPLESIEGRIDITDSNIKDFSDYLEEDYYWKKVTTINSGSWVVTKADTLFKKIERTIELNNRPGSPGEPQTEEIVNKGERLPDEEDDISIEEKIRRTIINETTTVTNQNSYFTIVDSVKKLNVDEFIDLIKKYPKAENNLTSAPSNFIYLLQQNEDTQQLEQIMRYVLFKLTGEDYGVTNEEDLEKLLDDSLKLYSSVNNLATYLRQFSHSTEAPKSDDGKYYKMYGDGKGWPTIGNADIQWKSHQGKFNKMGKVLENGIEKEVNIQEYVNSKLPRGASAEYSNEEVESYQIYVEVELVDTIGNKIQETYYNVVLNHTSGLNLSRQQLYALTTIPYNFGYLPTRNGKTFKETYEEATGLYEINSWEHNKYIWDNWWACLGGGSAGHIPARDAAFETYVKGVYDFSNSAAGKVFGRKYYIYYTSEQIENFSYAPSKPITRTSANEEDIFTYEECVGGISGTISINGYEYQQYTSSNGKTYNWYYQGYGPWSEYKSSSGNTMAAAGCFCTTSAIIGSGYGKTDTPHWGRSIYEFEMENTNNLSKGCSDSGSSGVNLKSNQIKQIQEWLFSGGEVIIHVGSGSKYTNNQHWMPIVDISDDGQQVYIMNTVQSYEGWNNINDLAICVDCYYRVKGLK